MEHAGTRARRHVTRVNDWKSGARPTPAEVQDRLCILGELTDSEIAAHVVARAGIERKPRLARIGTSIATAIGAFVIGAVAGVVPYTAHASDRY